MGFMVMECGLGLYTLALMHLIGHSLYKAHAFLAASGAVGEARLRMMRLPVAPAVASLVVAPFAAGAVVGLLAAVVPVASWPTWWSGVLALAWAPLLWWPAAASPDAPGIARRLLAGAAMVAALALAALLGHALPLGVDDAPGDAAGLVALAGMALLYACLALLQARPLALATWRRWSYAGFYVDEIATRWAMRLMPPAKTPAAAP
jgi:NAD(P)H-quinone oxidoreductase subunit 5